jgi:hypothetical protein
MLPILVRRALQPEAAAVHRLESVRASVAGRIGAINDSVAAAAAAERSARYWTRVDDDGAAWGVSPDAIHAGGVTLPLRICTAGPCPGSIFVAPAGRREEYAERARFHGEIRQQAQRAELQQVIADRVKAMRARGAAMRAHDRS